MCFDCIDSFNTPAVHISSSPVYMWLKITDAILFFRKVRSNPTYEMYRVNRKDQVSKYNFNTIKQVPDISKDITDVHKLLYHYVLQ